MWKTWTAVILLSCAIIAGVVGFTTHFGDKEPVNAEWIKQMVVTPSTNPSAAPIAKASATPTSSPSATPVPTSDGRIHLNTATVDELDQLPGIGPAKAAEIVKYREAHGRFGRLDELKLVNGIGDKTYAKLAPQLVLE